MSLDKQPFEKKEIAVRKIKDIDIDLFKRYIIESELVCNPESEVNALCNQYNSCLRELLNKHAPVKQKTPYVHVIHG